MSALIQKILDIDESEVTPVLLLLANSFFIGVFIVSYDVAASTIFLNTYGKKFLTFLPIFSGVLGMISTSIFAYFQRKIPFTRLTIISFFILTALVAVFFIGMEFFHINALNFVAFLFLGPINAIFLLCFYGTVARSFSLKREKHMTGTVDQGQMIATAIAYFTIPLVSPFVTDVAKFFVASIASGTLAVIFMAIFFYYVRQDTSGETSARKVQTDVAKLGQMAGSPYIRMLCLVFLASVMSTIFLEYSFLSVTVEKYKNEADLASFLGVFGGLVTVFSVVLQTFVADRIIKMYGMKVSLILIPSVLGIFAILASLIGTFFGYTEEAGSFIFFFLFMAMSKLFLQSLKESFEDPIVKTLFLPLEPRTRFDVQTKVEGFFKEFSGFIAGSLLTVLSFLSFFDLIFYSYFLVAICVFYFFIVVSLFVEYRKSLTQTLESQKGNSGEIEKKDFEVTDVLLKEINNKNPQTAIYTLKLMEKIEPIMAESLFLGLLDNDRSEIRKYSITRLEANRAIKAIEAIRLRVGSESEPEVKRLAIKALEDLNQTDSVEISSNMTYGLVKSRNVEDRIKAAQLIAKTKDDIYLPHLLLLLRDIEPRVRFAAMIASAKTERHETWPILIEYLSSYTFCNVAAATLITFGESVLPTLEAAFYKTGQQATIQEKIVQIYGRIQGPVVIELLWNKIDFPDKKIVNNILLCLSSCGFRPDEDRTTRIKQAIESEIGNSAWNIAVLTEIPNEEYSLLLKKALEEEIEFNFENVYMLLALIYDPQAIKLVKDNIESGTIEGLVFAIELLDVFLADELKPIFFPLIEDIPQTERNEKLQGHFPRQPLNSIEALKQIINRDYNQINKWTKACAIYCYANMPDAGMCDDLTANLFNPDPLLREIAAWAILQKDPLSYHRNKKRLGESIKKELDARYAPSQDYEDEYSRHEHKFMTKIEKIFFLKTLDGFKNVPGVILVEFVELIEEVRIKKDEIILAKGVTGESPLYIIVKGKAVIWEKPGDVLNIVGERELIGETLILNSDTNPYNITAAEDTIMFRIDKDMLFEQITDNFEIAKEFISVVSKKFVSTDNEIVVETLFEEKD